MENYPDERDQNQNLQTIEGLTAELVQTRDQLVALFQVSQAARGCWQVEQVLARTVETIDRLVSAQAVLLSIKPEGESCLTYQTPKKFLSERSLERVLACPNGRELLASGSFGTVRPVGPHRVLVLPLEIRGTEEATLGLVLEPGQQLKSPEIKLVRAVADYAGAQIENVLLFQAKLDLARLETEMELAHQVQARLLPQRTPAAPGLQAWGASQPAFRVGGDFYDFVCGENDGSFNFLVGDVSGKGLPAALIMAMTRTILRTGIREAPDPNPEELLRRANAALYDDFCEQNMFATVFAGSYHPKTRYLELANAGHSPVIYSPVNGAVRLIEPDGVPLGILPRTHSENHGLKLQLGDVFLVGTDGITEAENEAGDRYGMDRLLDTVERYRHLSAESIGQRIVDDVRSFRNRRAASDDLTLVVLKSVGG